MGEFRLFLTELYAGNTSLFYFQDNNLSKSWWIFFKCDVRIDIMEVCFGIAHRQICRFLTELSAHDRIMVGYYCSIFYYYNV